MRKKAPPILLLVCVATNAFGLQPKPGALFVRVIDVGPGLCCVAIMPSGHTMVYDAGSGRTAIKGISELLPEGGTIDLLVLSHGDADHIGGVPDICDRYRVKRVVRTGDASSSSWKNAVEAIEKEEDCEDINFRENALVPGISFRFGSQGTNNTFVSIISGFGKAPESWKLMNRSDLNNAISIVVRLRFSEKSILFCGDIVGRSIGDRDTTCIAAEKFIVENSWVINVDSDIVIAPHNGSDSASSLPFIETVQPRYVIFSAGHKFGHPRAAVAGRYLRAGVPIDNLFRTDRGDNEGGDEWRDSHPEPKPDPPGDDDVDILIGSDGNIKVDYRSSRSVRGEG